jgi:transketolase
MTHTAKAAHVGTSLSMADLLAVLYGGVLRIDPARPDWAERDRLILSKGHGCAGLYAVLAERGFFPLEWLDQFYQDGSRLAGHITHVGVPGVEVSTGALGHGLSIGCGMALAGKRDGRPFRVFALLSDGECDEGSVWEAIMFASHHGLDNLTAIVDYNKIQALGCVQEILDPEPIVARWSSFGWATREINGHNFEEILTATDCLPFERGKPSVIIAHTVKGKGVSFMENNVLWHYRAPDDHEYNMARKEIFK